MSLLAEMNHKALKLGVPLSVHLDITYRCNERCVHCYLDHDDHGELSTAEIKDVLNQLSEAGVFFLTLSGGEVLMRRDFFEILEFSRRLLFNVKLKTNAGMIREPEARRIRESGVAEVQISVYSHRAAVHDAITKLPGSWKRTTDAIRFLRSQGLKVTIANVLMSANWSDYSGVVALAHELGATYTVDPTITPKIDGDSSIVKLRIEGSELNQLFHDPNLVGDVQEFCAPPPPPGGDVMEGYPCSAGHTSCYISPYGDVFPCVQFPLRAGMCASKDSWISGKIRRNSSRFARFGPKTCRLARPAHMWEPARAVPGSPTWKAICWDLPLQIVRSPFREPVSRPLTW